jgi:cytochrome c2
MKMKRTIFFGMGAAVILAGILIMLSVEVSGDASVDRGREVYVVQKCAMCHTISGVGGDDFPLDGVGTRMRADVMRKWIRTPKEMKPDTTMKAYPNLPEKDLQDLINYLLTLK